MNPDEWAQHSWAYGFWFAGFQMLAIVMICYVRFVIELFRRGEKVYGWIFGICLVFIGGGWTIGVLAGLPLGWKYASKWKFNPWMVVWSLALVGSLANLLVGGLLLSLSLHNWRRYFGWVPSF